MAASEDQERDSREGEDKAFRWEPLLKFAKTLRHFIKRDRRNHGT